MSLQKLMANYAAYNQWANQTQVEWLKTKPSELLEKEVPSSFSSIVKTLNHILAVEEFWYAVITETQQDYSRYGAEVFDADEIISGLLQQSQQIVDYASSLSEADLLQEVYLDTPWVKGTMPRYEFLHHVLNHSTYHRGQVVTIGRNVGITDAPMTDYNYFNMALVNA